MPLYLTYIKFFGTIIYVKWRIIFILFNLFALRANKFHYNLIFYKIYYIIYIKYKE